MTVETVIRNGRVVDGTGAPWFRGSIAIDDGEIVDIIRGSTAPPSADSVIDAEGAVVCPGFIDTHSHSDLELFNEELLMPKIRQGITTEILGQDGFSMAPMHPENGKSEWQQHLSGLAGTLDGEWTWETTSEYFDAIEANGIGLNVAMLVGHGTLRFNVLGMDDREPTDKELQEMRSLAVEAFEEGAIGLSTGLIYPPCSYADTSELGELVSELQAYQRPFVAHVRSEGRWIWDALDEFVDLGAEYDIPLHLSHFKVAGTKQHGKASRAIELLETARERGVDITAEQYPYTAGSTMLSAVIPQWVFADGPEKALERLDDSSARERIESEIEHWEIEGWENVGGLAGWENISVTSVETDDNRHLVGSSISEIASNRDISPVGAVCNLLVEEDLEVGMRLHILDEEDVHEIVQYERVNVATDGLFGGTPHPRVYGTYPKILEKYVRDQDLLSVEEAIRKMTSLPARAMGLTSKGVLRPGMDADIVVLDPDTVESRATYDDPRQYPSGITDVLVNGTFVVREENITGNTPGRVIR